MKTFYPKNGDEWRNWLQSNHRLEQEVWLVFYRKGTGKPAIDFDEAIDSALCFGWIDSAIRKIDDLRYARKFTPRRPGSVWSKSNIERVKALIGGGRMTEYGAALFRERTGKTSFAERFRAEEPPFPPEFLRALKKNGQAWANFQEFTPGYKRRYLMWIASAKRVETRDRRIEEAVSLIAKNVKSLTK